MYLHIGNSILLKRKPSSKFRVILSNYVMSDYSKDGAQHIILLPGGPILASYLLRAPSPIERCFSCLSRFPPFKTDCPIDISQFI